MKPILALFGILSIFSTYAQAAEVTCHSKKQTYEIRTDSKNIWVKELKGNKNFSIWSRDDAGLYSYFARDVLGVSKDNFEHLNLLRLDFGNKKKIENFEIGEIFEGEIAFIFYNITIDYSDYQSLQTVSCKRMN